MATNVTSSPFAGTGLSSEDSGFTNEDLTTWLLRDLYQNSDAVPAASAIPYDANPSPHSYIEALPSGGFSGNLYGVASQVVPYLSSECPDNNYVKSFRDCLYSLHRGTRGSPTYAPLGATFAGSSETTPHLGFIVPSNTPSDSGFVGSDGFVTPYNGNLAPTAGTWHIRLRRSDYGAWVDPDTSFFFDIEVAEFSGPTILLLYFYEGEDLVRVCQFGDKDSFGATVTVTPIGDDAAGVSPEVYPWGESTSQSTSGPSASTFYVFYNARLGQWLLDGCADWTIARGRASTYIEDFPFQTRGSDLYFVTPTLVTGTYNTNINVNNWSLFRNFVAPAGTTSLGGTSGMYLTRTHFDKFFGANNTTSFAFSVAFQPGVTGDMTFNLQNAWQKSTAATTLSGVNRVMVYYSARWGWFLSDRGWLKTSGVGALMAQAIQEELTELMKDVEGATCPLPFMNTGCTAWASLNHTGPTTEGYIETPSYTGWDGKCVELAASGGPGTYYVRAPTNLYTPEGFANTLWVSTLYVAPFTTFYGSDPVEDPSYMILAKTMGSNTTEGLGVITLPLPLLPSFYFARRGMAIDRIHRGVAPKRLLTGFSSGDWRTDFMGNRSYPSRVAGPSYAPYTSYLTWEEEALSNTTSIQMPPHNSSNEMKVLNIYVTSGHSLTVTLIPANFPAYRSTPFAFYVDYRAGSAPGGNYTIMGTSGNVIATFPITTGKLWFCYSFGAGWSLGAHPSVTVSAGALPDPLTQVLVPSAMALHAEGPTDADYTAVSAYPFEADNEEALYEDDMARTWVPYIDWVLEGIATQESLSPAGYTSPFAWEVPTGSFHLYDMTAAGADPTADLSLAPSIALSATNSPPTATAVYTKHSHIKGTDAIVTVSLPVPAGVTIPFYHFILATTDTPAGHDLVRFRMENGYGQWRLSPVLAISGGVFAIYDAPLKRWYISTYRASVARRSNSFSTPTPGFEGYVGEQTTSAIATYGPLMDWVVEPHDWGAPFYSIRTPGLPRYLTRNPSQAPLTASRDSWIRAASGASSTLTPESTALLLVPDGPRTTDMAPFHPSASRAMSVTVPQRVYRGAASAYTPMSTMTRGGDAGWDYHENWGALTTLPHAGSATFIWSRGPDLRAYPPGEDETHIAEAWFPLMATPMMGAQVDTYDLVPTGTSGTVFQEVEGTLWSQVRTSLSGDQTSVLATIPFLGCTHSADLEMEVQAAIPSGATVPSGLAVALAFTCLPAWDAGVGPGKVGPASDAGKNFTNLTYRVSPSTFYPLCRETGAEWAESLDQTERRPGDESSTLPAQTKHIFHWRDFRTPEACRLYLQVYLKGLGDAKFRNTDSLGASVATSNTTIGRMTLRVTQRPWCHVSG